MWTPPAPRKLGSFSPTSQFRMELDNLARFPASPHSSTTGTLSFLTEEGIAQMAINLLSFFQHLIIKCGERGVVVVMRYIVSSGSRNGGIIVLQHFPANHSPPPLRID